MTLTTKCHYCGRFVWRGKRAGQREDQQATRDHKVPKCQGGRGADNFVIACQRCNLAKADGHYSDFAEFASIMLRVVAPRASAVEAGLAFRAWQIARLM